MKLNLASASHRLDTFCSTKDPKSLLPFRDSDPETLHLAAESHCLDR